MGQLEEVKAGPAGKPGAFSPGALTTLSPPPPPGGGLAVERIDVTPAIGTVLGLEMFEAHSWAELRRPRPVRGEIRLAEGELVATLDDVRVSLTRLQNPAPTPQKPYNYVVLGFSYHITSHGFATGLPDPGAGQGVVYPSYQGINEQDVRFHGPNGIPVYTWRLSFKLHCGWHQKYEYFGNTLEEVVPWATLWNGQWSHQVNGWFTSC